MNINDFGEQILAFLGFISSNYVAGAVREKGKQVTERKQEKKEELVTRVDIINTINSVCFVLCMGLHSYANFTLFTEKDFQKRTVRTGTASMLAMSIAIATPKKRIDKSENNS